jgi:hypothetical protein
MLNGLNAMKNIGRTDPTITTQQDTRTTTIERGLHQEVHAKYFSTDVGIMKKTWHSANTPTIPSTLFKRTKLNRTQGERSSASGTRTQLIPWRTFNKNKHARTMPRTIFWGTGISDDWLLQDSAWVRTPIYLR